MDSFTIRDVPGARIITIVDSASLNDFRTNAFRDKLYEALADPAPQKIALNLSKVEFLSSSGVAILVGLKRRIEPSGGKFVIYGIHPVVQDLLHITRLTQFFTFAPDEAEALAMLRPVSTA